MEQYRDPVLSRIISDIKKNHIRNTDYLIRDEVLCQKVKQDNGRTKILKIVPQSYQWSIINYYHEALKHCGWEKTLDKLKEHFWFDKMSLKVRSFIDNCVVCKTLKGRNPIEKNVEPFNTIYIDISGKFSGPSSEKEYVFVAADAFSKFVLLKYASKKN
ncbi:jg18668 [Pararge aegeria aegeria]|uniref:RNA-directed DNA polymerase n=1 Tax=Pararge aegeria aegeria TaxID=348720 RepID=A0A8S4S0V1_9NEOP|nr:jg18668 [Pararge aegeria aegeria]